MQPSPKNNSIFVLYTKDFGQVLVGDHLYNGQSQTMALPRFSAADKSELEDAKKFVSLQLGISLESIASVTDSFHPQDAQLRIFTAQLTSDELPAIKDSSDVKYSFQEVERALDLLDMDDQSFDQEAIKHTLPLFHLTFTDNKYGDGVLSGLVRWSQSSVPNRIYLATSYDMGDAGRDFTEALTALSTKGYATVTFDPEGPISTMILLRSRDDVHMIIYASTHHYGRYDEESKALVEIDTYILYDLFMTESMRALRQYVEEQTMSQYGKEHGKKIGEALAKVQP